MTVADYPDWGGEATLAQYVAVNGVPLLTGLTLLQTITAQTVATGTSTTFPSSGQIPVKTPSYEFIGQFHSSGAPAFTKVNINWFDAAGTLIFIDIAYFYPGTAAGVTHDIVGNGPTKGASYNITVQAFTANAVIDSLAFYGCSRIYSNNVIKTRGFTGLATGGAVPASVEMSTLHAGQRSTAVGIGATDNSTIALFNGKVRLWANTSSGAADLNIKVTASTDQAPAGNHIVASLFSDSHGNINNDIVLPIAQCNLSMFNGNAAGQTCQYNIIAEEY